MCIFHVNGQQLKNTSLKPNEIVKESFMGMNDGRFAAGNFTNVITNRKQVYNMNQENRLDARKELGILEFEINSSACNGLRTMTKKEEGK